MSSLVFVCSVLVLVYAYHSLGEPLSPGQILGWIFLVSSTFTVSYWPSKGERSLILSTAQKYWRLSGCSPPSMPHRLNISWVP